MDDKDWVRKWAVDGRGTDQPHAHVPGRPGRHRWSANTPDGRKQLDHARWGLPTPFCILRKAAETSPEKL